ncbi:MAG: alpha/beta hydrolase [Ferruginibacter sp.]
MKKILLLFVLFCACGFVGFASPQADSSFIETPVTLHTSTGDIFGTLTVPKNKSVMPVALMIAGSGPTDRNGNNPAIKGANNNFKLMAEAMADAGIASLRFDKRGIAESVKAMKKEADLRFDDYINDAEAWIDLLKKDKRFIKIIIIGHSEGSLVGMVAAKQADKYISMAGAGRSIDIILKEQLSSKPPEAKEVYYSVLDSLKAGIVVKNIKFQYYDLLRPSIQPYMISWIKYDPQVEIKKLTIPVLILQGTHDLQVKVEDAKKLSEAYPKATLVLVQNMNHVLKIVTGDTEENIKAYGDPSLPLAPLLIKTVIDFINAK